MSIVKQCDRCCSIVNKLYRYLRKEKNDGKWDADAIDLCDDCYQDLREWITKGGTK